MALTNEKLRMSGIDLESLLRQGNNGNKESQMSDNTQHSKCEEYTENNAEEGENSFKIFGREVSERKVFDIEELRNLPCL